MHKNFQLWGFLAGSVLLAACRDPFPPDSSRVPRPGPIAAPVPPAAVPAPSGVAPPGLPPAPVAPPAGSPPAPEPGQPPGGTPPAPGGNPGNPPVPTPPVLTIAEGPICEQLPDPADPAAANACPEDLDDLDDWFPTTPEVDSCLPRPRPSNTCAFYQFAWQHFLVATQPNEQGAPEFLAWETIETTFGGGNRFPPGAPVLSGSLPQAGSRQILTDQTGKAIYYGIHLNDEFRQFVRRNDLDTVDGIKKAPAELQFPVDVVQLRSAWQIVGQGTAPNQRMISAAVRVPTLRVVRGEIEEDRTVLREVTAQLIALDVAFTIPGHPEFIWSTFEAVAENGISFVAPTAAALPPPQSMTPITQDLDAALFGNGNFVLFPRMGGRTGLPLPVGQKITGLVAADFNQANQQFTQRTSVHRVFPSSLSHTKDVDEVVEAINEAVQDRFNSRAPGVARPLGVDRRGNYSIVGAVWLDKPKDSFGTDRELANDPTDADILANGTRSEKSILAGHDRLSSTANESFTQAEFSNCLSCHDTRSATELGVPLARDELGEALIEPKQINVSRVFEEVVRLTDLGVLK
jgi:hypothetical protein